MIKMIEVEIKAKIDNIQEIETFLKDMNAKFIEQIREVDRYYQHPCRDFATTDEALRLREKNNEIKLTYKGPKLNKISKTREEFEINIDKKSLNTFHKILERIGFTLWGIVEKTRRIYQIEEITISLDQVKKLGAYIEFEIMVKSNSDIDQALKKIFALASKIGIKKEDYIRKSYLELVMGL